ncbi:MAG: hypothetical protein IK066_10010 [Kiritimatiellae bacterium]|nr:hypothetical protein [Kiritimatiellia bacterium]
MSLLDKMGEKIKSSNVGLHQVLLLVPRGSADYYPIFPALRWKSAMGYYGPFFHGRVSLGRLQSHDIRDIDSVSVEVTVE